MDIGRVTSSDFDEIKNLFDDFVKEVKSDTLFTNYGGENLDDIYYNSLSKSTKWNKLWKVIGTLLLLSHGQAAVERGFSLNKNVAVDNLSEQNLVNLRVVKDHIIAVGGVKNVVVSKELLASSSARQRYEADLLSKRNSQLSDDKKRKYDMISKEVDELKKKKKLVQSELSQMESEADRLYDKAEMTGKVQFVASANSLRKAAKDKKIELELIIKSTDEKVKEMKNAAK